MSDGPGASATGAVAASPSFAAPPRVRWIAALALAVVATVSLAWRSPSLACGDLCSYYAAGLLARGGDPAAAFDAAALERRHREVHDLGQRTGPFLYSPLFLGPAAALAGDPLPEAARRHRIAGAALLGLGLFAVLLALERLAAQVAVAAAFALAHAAWVQLVYANWSFALFAFVAAVMLALVRGRGRLAIVAGALAIHLKPFVLFAFVPLVAARRRLVVAIGVVTLLLAGLALPFTGTAPWAKFGSFLAGRGAAGVTPFYSKSSLAANVARLGTEVREWVAPRRAVDSPAVKAVFWAGLPLLLWGARRLRDRPAAAFAFGLAWILLFVPQIWEHTEILLFAALPALAHRTQLLLAAVLALTVSYNSAQQRLLAAALSGESGEAAVRALLWLYPLLALFVLVTALGATRPAPHAPAASPA